MNHYIYILTNRHHTVLYTGMTSSLSCRLYEHTNKIHIDAFSKKYNLFKLVYYEVFSSKYLALERERLIKKKSRRGKNHLINRQNPNWDNLSEL